ncbi:hypothetical protein J2Z35_000519 [Acetoanaerobium pronyense]|uniref:Copper amine oxidase-like N-terminal domain-containing protein n=1 Tax=Acetoanaerobium pronyense TaxID=1482736 RepID=A0ABS4KH91_9FIRM|nr:hypothetical protein [Acetoanaerobium pronyense]MBP2026730.1 hypothetical protein [Acetoanaerobium pronyense]
MKRFISVFMMVFVLFTNLSFASPEANYWDELKEVYDWEYMESQQTMRLKFDVPGQFSGDYVVDMTGKGNMSELVSKLDIKITDAKGAVNLPDISFYTNGTDFYINTSAFEGFMSLMGVELGEIEEDYIMVKNTQSPVDMNSEILKELLGFIEDIELDVDLGMVQEGRTYTLELDSDKLIDLLDSYMRYVIANLNNMPTSFMPEDMKISEEEIEEALIMYDQMVTPYIPVAKEMIKGSNYVQVTVFEDSAYTEEATLNIVSPFVNGQMTINSSAKEVESLDLSLPTSVKVMTEEDLNSLIMPGGELTSGNYLMIGLDGQYMHITPSQEVVTGKLSIKNEGGFTFVNVNEISGLLGVIIETNEEYIRTTDLVELGFTVNWNSENRTIEIY